MLSVSYINRMIARLCFSKCSTKVGSYDFNEYILRILSIQSLEIQLSKLMNI